MSRVNFGYGASHRLLAACRLIAQQLQGGRRIVVYCSDAVRLRRFDTLLWEFEPVSFIPHTRVDDPLAEKALVHLAENAGQLAQAESTQARLLNLDLQIPPDARRFDQILEVVSRHDADRSAARTRWKQYRDAGHDVRGAPLPDDIAAPPFARPS